MRVIGLLMLLATSACPSYALRGVAHGTPKCDEARHGTSFPLERAALTISCPDGTRLAAESDDVGRFHLPLSAPLPGACSVEVSKDGFAPRRFTIADLCVYEVNDEFPDCDAASLFARLVPR